MRIAAATVVVGACGIGVAQAQVVPARVQGEYAIGSCAAPEVIVTIDGSGMTVADARGQTISSVLAQSAQDVGGRVEMQVLVDGAAGSLTLVDLGGGAIDVLYTEQGQAPEPAQRLELCAAAVVETDDPGAIPPLTFPTVPAILIGEFATGSCAAPLERLVIEETRVEAFTGSTSNGVAEVIEVTEIVDGYALYIDLAGTRGTLEMSIINQDIVEAVFVPDGASTPAPETLYRCTPVQVADEPVIEEPVIEEPVIEEPVIDEPVIDESLATTLPAEYLGRYALGASCDDPALVIDFQPTQLVALEGGNPSMTIEVQEVTATSPDLEFVALSDGRVGDVVMQAVGNGRYTITFTDRASGLSEQPETLTLCSSADPVEPTMGSAGVGGFLFDDPVERFGGLMADLATTCQPGSEQACLDAFWEFADITGDGQLTGPELARVVRYALKWGVAENVPALRLGQQVAVHIGSMVTGPLVANGMIYNHDYDGNNALSQAELFPDGVQSAPMAVPALMELISESTLEDLFEALEELERM